MVQAPRFASFELAAPILSELEALGYETPTPVQSRVIPEVLKGNDLFACAQTGTGKTAAFALPILHRLSESSAVAPAVRALVLTPTRELAIQIGQNFEAYGRGLKLRVATLYGGVSQRSQEATLRKGADILVATPGRLLDLIKQKIVLLDQLEIFVLDEADRMLDMGFIQDVRKIIKSLPKKRQTLFFSATMPKEIGKLADQILVQPLRIEVAPPSTPAERVAQALFRVPENQKTHLLIHMLGDPTTLRVLVFTRTKHDANRVSKSLVAAGIEAIAIHGNKTQKAREQALEKIKKGKIRVLVATDIAARGIDIDEVSHVFNYDTPNVPESYIHRIGRTARGGHAGIAVTFCSPKEERFLSDIEKHTRKHLSLITLPNGLRAEKRASGRRRAIV